MMKKIIKNDLMTRENFETLVQDKVFEDTEIAKELRLMRKDVAYSQRVKKIAEKIYEFVKNISRGKFNYNQKNKRQKRLDYLKEVFDLEKVIK